MRVLIVNTSERTGGAAVAAHRLMNALQQEGVEARMLVRDKLSQSDAVTALPHRWRTRLKFLWERWCVFWHLRFRRRHLWEIDLGLTGTDITRLPEFQQADIIHLHWVNQSFLSIDNIRQILESGKPVVWTLHDFWPITAVCHYPHECFAYTQSCGGCHFLPHPSVHDLSYRVMKKKQKVRDSLTLHYRPHFVAVSQWMAQCARESALAKHCDVTVIPNVLSISDFELLDKQKSRQSLGVTTPYVLAFGAHRLDNPIKGFSILCDALHLLAEREGIDPNEITLLLFGGLKNASVLQSLPVPYLYLGYVNTPQQLSTIYSASEAVINASSYETFGQTLIEALACGSRAVTFDNSGPCDIVRHKVNGYLCKAHQPESLCDGILWVLNNEVDRNFLREDVIKRFSQHVVASQYIKLYHSLLTSHTSKHD